MNSIPVIDLSELEQGAKRRSICVVKLGDALHRVGFTAIQGHQVPTTLIQKLREAVRDLFERPQSEKMNLLVEPGNYRGYIPMGFFTPNGGDQLADQYEAYKLHHEVNDSDPITRQCDLYGANKWPSETTELQNLIHEYWQECERVSDLLLMALCEHLNVDHEFVRDCFEKPLSNMTLLHYPPLNCPPLKNDSQQFGIHPHKDTDVLTILAADPIGGLFVRPRDSQQWISVSVPDDALIVNVGDMLEVWSGGYFMSTPHKVLSPKLQHRYSFPYFAVPRYDVVIEPLIAPDSELIKSCVEHRSMHVGEVSAKIWRSNWPDAEAIDDAINPYMS